MFATKLLSYGWHDKFAAARIEKYEIRSLEMFAVQPDFPRIVSSGLPMGVGGVSYSVDRSAIDEFLISTDEFADRLKEQQI
ncbi:hypothetical protein A5633_04115 [Mycolicibacterium elephantis]|nr:hypothetical protein A5633_04115 [Mycolicibacterium elephantis]